MTKKMRKVIGVALLCISFVAAFRLLGIYTKTGWLPVFIMIGCAAFVGIVVCSVWLMVGGNGLDG